MIIRFSPEGDAELAEANQWYAHQREDLDIEFMQSIDDALSRIVSIPLFTELSDAQLFAVFRSLSFMKSQRMRFG